jgi:peptidoglycan/LPS O-acetylase OafA/YrhL
VDYFIRAESTTAGRSSRLGYLPWMDGIRAVAVLCVIAYHEALFLPGSRLSTLLPVGALGVDVFFAISGFLITSLLLEEATGCGAIAFGAFYVRRARRLLPGLAALVALVVVAALLFEHGAHRAHTLEHAALASAYTTNWVQALTPHNLGVFGHTWSLGTEEQFYLMWPLLLAVLLGAGFRGHRLVAALGVISAYAVLWPQFAVSRGWAGSRINYGLDTRGAGLALGAMLGAAFVSGVLPGTPTWRAVRGLAAVASVALIGVLMHDAGAAVRVASWLGIDARRLVVEEYALVSLGTVCIIWELFEARPHVGHRLLSWRPLVWIGRISYGLYLWDGAIALGLTPAATGIHNATQLAVVHVTLTFAAATASWYLIERRFRRRRAPTQLDLVTPPVRSVELAPLVSP